jgi:iron(III) transport system permease protein
MDRMTPSFARVEACESSGKSAWRRMFPYLTGRSLVFVVAALPLLVVLALLGVIIAVSFVDDIARGVNAAFTLKNFRALFGDPLIYSALLNTIGFTIVTVAIAMGIGGSVAWLVERTDLPGKRLVYVIMTVGLLVPTFFMAMGWVFFLHPRIGMLNRWLMDLFSLDSAPLSIANVVGMGWVEGLGLASMAFMMIGPVFKALNPSLDEAATVHGLGRWKTLRFVVLPLMWPALLATAIYISVIAFAAFDVPAIIGLGNRIFTFATVVYLRVTPDTGVPNYGFVGAVSVILIIISTFLSGWYFRVIRLSHRYGVVQGRGYRPKLAQLGKKAWICWLGLGLYFFMSKVMPLAIMVWAALLPYFQPFSFEALSRVSFANFTGIDWSLVERGAINTVTLVFWVPTLSLIFGLAISWLVVRSNLRGRFLYDWVSFLPHAVPSMVFALAAVIFALFVVPQSVPIYGTITILVVVFVLVRISLVTRVLNGALLQINRELEDAANVNGIGTLSTLWKVIVPLLLPAILNLWIWNALLAYRELTVAAFMVTQDNITLPVVVWGLWNGGQTGQSAAVSIIFVIFLIPLVVAYWALRTNAEFQQSPRA